MTGGKALHDEVNDRIRKVLRELMEARAWEQKRAAQELGVKQQSISSFLKRDTGASLFLAWEIAKAAKQTLDELLTGEPDGRAHRFDTLPGWAESEATARAAFDHVPDQAFVAVRGWRTEEWFSASPSLIGKLAEAWLSARRDAGSPSADAKPPTKKPRAA